MQIHGRSTGGGNDGKGLPETGVRGLSLPRSTTASQTSISTDGLVANERPPALRVIKLGLIGIVRRVVSGCT